MNANKIVSKLLEDDAPATNTTLKGKPAAEATALVGEHYHDNLTYKGNEFFDSIYMDKIIPRASKSLGITNPMGYKGGHNVKDNDGQESYLGYLPDEDVFISEAVEYVKSQSDANYEVVDL